MDSTQKPKHPLYKNPLESLRDSGGSETRTSNEFFRPMADEFMNQILGRKKKFGGELLPGESIEMRSVFTGKQTEVDRIKGQLVIERQLHQEERVLVEKRSNELKLQIEAIQVEVTKIAKSTPQLAREVEIAALQAPVNMSIYELFFFQHLFEFIKSFREHIENAHVWLSAINTRARKKNMWGANYKKYGAKYLLSGEHYSGRSAA
jgi:hypothetical protein